VLAIIAKPKYNFFIKNSTFFIFFLGLPTLACRASHFLAHACRYATGSLFAHTSQQQAHQRTMVRAGVPAAASVLPLRGSPPHR
jgi:hypothetical protein